MKPDTICAPLPYATAHKKKILKLSARRADILREGLPMYELSDEDKRKIREEEEAAAERARYRAYVKNQLHGSTVRQPGIAWKRVFLGFFAIVAVLLTIGQWAEMGRMTRSSARDESSALRRLLTQVDPIVTQRVVQIRPTNVVWWHFAVEDRMQKARVFGAFRAAGGWGDDVEVIIATEDEFFNWKAGQGGNLAWSSMGKKTAGSFNVQLEPGKYVIGISNKHSLVSSKNVSIGANLGFQHFAF